MLASSTGCHLWEITHEPIVHNPFPQLSRVAVAPFFNQSDEPTVDGRKVALAYFAELQATRGFEVVPLGVVEDAILAHRVDLSNPGEARRLAQILGVDAVVIGSVTDFTPYYPPRCGLRVEWYAANAGFHEIPPGYGLPWGTPEEEFIPQPLVFEAEFALAKAQLATQTPECPAGPLDPPSPPVIVNEPRLLPAAPAEKPTEEKTSRDNETGDDADVDAADAGMDAEAGSAIDENDSENTGAILTAYDEQTSEEELPPSIGSDGVLLPPQSPPSPEGDTTGATGAHEKLPEGWPDQSRFVPAAPTSERPACVPYNGPVMTHTRLYLGNDSDFAEALATYYHFRTDARFGGWETYLQRSDDFIRFCCHLHIHEMLSARGGADETRVRWEWSDCR
jgi:hypothetical protein